MANKDFERMIKLGEWLEEYLKPEIPEWKLLKLFQEGAYLIGVNEKVSPECEISLFLMGNLPEEKYSNTEKELIQKKVEVFLKYRNDLQKILEAVLKYNLPWEKIFVEFEDDDFLNTIAGFFRSKYSELRETIKKIDGEYCITKTFNPIPFASKIHAKTSLDAAKKALEPYKDNLDYDRLRQKILEPYENSPKLNIQTENPTFELKRNYLIILSRILFDFLILGGQKYYILCEYCGRFTVIRRKGRKKYCSDICRTNHGREKRSE